MTTLDSLLEFPRDQYEALDEAGRAEFDALLGREMSLSSPAMFAVAHSHGLWVPYRHLTITSSAVVDMIEHDTCDCLVVEEPVRHGKSELCSRWTPAWYVCRYRGRVGLASYEADFAATHGRKARNIVEEVGHLYDVRIDPTSNAANRWDAINADAGMWTAGAGGPITGKGGGLLVVDDPIKNAEDAASKVLRDKTWEWWQTVFLTRRNNRRAKVLVIMSRWHVDDLVGRLHTLPTGMRIKFLRFPALAEDDDPLGREPGEALCPDIMDEDALVQFREDVGPSAFMSLYQQRPTPPGGGMFKRASFRYWTRVRGADDKAIYQLGDDDFIDPAECWTFSTMDTAYTRNQRSDYTVLATWAVAPTKPAPSLLLLDVQRVRVEGADHLPMMRRAWDRWSPAWIGIEKQNATRTLFDEASLAGIVTNWLNPSTNKRARAESAVALMDAGRIWFPRGAQWLGEYEDELLTFPVGAHDDQVDVTSYAATELIARRVHPKPSRHKPTTLEERCWAQLERRARRNTHHHPVIGRIA
jgi:predicted phage terminase large subunit-like protein